MEGGLGNFAALPAAVDARCPMDLKPETELHEQAEGPLPQQWELPFPKLLARAVSPPTPPAAARLWVCMLQEGVLDHPGQAGEPLLLTLEGVHLQAHLGDGAHKGGSLHAGAGSPERRLPSNLAGPAKDGHNHVRHQTVAAALARRWSWAQHGCKDAPAAALHAVAQTGPQGIRSPPAPAPGRSALSAAAQAVPSSAPGWRPAAQRPAPGICGLVRR